MKANRIITSILLAVAFFALPALTFAQTDSTADDPDSKYATELLKPGTPAPDFTLTTPDGKTVKLSDYRGKYVVIDFWASWCPDCRKDAPAIVAMHHKYSGDYVAFLGVSFDTDKEAWVKAIDKLGIKYTQVSNLKKWKETEVSKAYHLNWIPTLYVIDPDGNIMLGTVVSSKVRALLELVGNPS